MGDLLDENDTADLSLKLDSIKELKSLFATHFARLFFRALRLLNPELGHQRSSVGATIRSLL